MFKKFQDWFFKEDIDELDLEESLMDEEETPKRQYEEVVQRRVQVEKPVEEKVNEPMRQQAVTPTVKPVEKPKINFDIKADEPAPKEGMLRDKARTIRRDEFDMPPVISPYFGIKEETIQNGSNPVRLNKLPTDKKHERFNDVISPIYGIHNHDIQVETKNILNEEELNFFHEEKVEEQKAYEIPIPAHGTLEFRNEDSTESLEEEENLALDEIIADTNNEEEDLIQFSLFGESKRIQEDDFENEEIDNGDDTLPF